MVHEFATAAEFTSALSANATIVVDFHAQWCGPCKRIAPQLEALAKDNPDVFFGKVDVDELPSIAQEYNVEAMPTFILIKNGKVVDTVVGASVDKVKAAMMQHLK